MMIQRSGPGIAPLGRFVVSDHQPRTPSHARTLAASVKYGVPWHTKLNSLAFSDARPHLAMRDARQEGGMDVEALMARIEADLASARNIVRRLEGQLDDARRRATKLEHSLEVAREYAGAGVSGAPVLGRVRVVEGANSVVPGGSPRTTGGASGIAVRAVVDMLREARKPIRTRDLVDALKSRGFGFGSDPSREVVNLSGYLSRSPELVADRVAGWRLKEWDEQAPRSDTAPVAGTPAHTAGTHEGGRRIEGASRTETWEMPPEPFRLNDPQTDAASQPFRFGDPPSSDAAAPFRFGHWDTPKPTEPSAQAGRDKPKPATADADDDIPF